MLNTTVKFRVNGLLVANEQFQSKTQAGLDRAVSHYKTSTEFIIRATLKQSGADRATIVICEGPHEIEYVWLAGEASFGLLREGKILVW